MKLHLKLQGWAMTGLLLVLSAGFGSQLVEAATPSALSITNVAGDRVAFRPGQDEMVTVRFRLSASADMEMRIYDSRDLLVRSVQSAGTLPAADGALVWDGRTDNGEIVPPEAYFYTLAARPQGGKGDVIYDVTDSTRGSDRSIEEMTIDAESRTVRYVIPGPSRVSFRLGMRDGGPLLATLVNFEPRVALVDTATWPERFSLSEDALALFGEYFRLPANTIVVQPEPGGRFERRFVAGAAERRVRKPRERHMYRHSQHARDRCYDFEPVLDLVGEVREDGPEGMPAIGANVALRVDLKPEDRAFVEGQRFETVFYLDGVFLTEMEQGFVPVRWPLDPVTVPGGTHLLTVNLRGYEGHFGSASIRFVKPAGDAGRSGSPAGSAEQR